jgi:hypothetical protein
MTLDWQTLIAVALVLLAAGYLCRRGWQTIVRKRAGCGACSNCPADHDTAGKPLVTIDKFSKSNSP